MTYMQYFTTKYELKERHTHERMLSLCCLHIVE